MSRPDGLPTSPVRAMSAQRVQIKMNPDGSITKVPPSTSTSATTTALAQQAAIDEELELEHPTVAAPVNGPDLAAGEVPPPVSLQGLPVDDQAVADMTVTKDAIDDERTHDVKHLKGASLNETKHIMDGVPKEDLWTLMRRFDKNVGHVRAIDPHKKLHGGRLDLRLAAKDEDPFTPDKFRAALERTYLTIVLGMIAFSKHVVRLSNWEDVNRTATFASIYFIAWMFNLLLPTLSTFIAILITVPISRRMCFPPQKLALIDHATSGNAPAAPGHGEKISSDSATGAPEAQKGEAAEQEASSFVNGLGTIAVALGTGTEGPSEKEGEKNKSSLIPDPIDVVSRATDAMDTAADGRKHHTTENKAKAPLQNAMWEATKPMMHGLALACDTWEKMANALSPTPPFHRNGARLRMAALLVPAILGSPFISYDIIFKGISFAIGVGFFGQVWIVKYTQEGLAWLNTTYPNWVESLDLGRTVLRGVPTDAQLALTLLRIAEAQNEPLPPPPKTDPSGAAAPPARQGHEPIFNKGEADSNSDSDIEEVYNVPMNTQDGQPQGAGSQKRGARARLTGLLRGTVKLGAETVEVTHRAEAATIGRATEKVGVLPPGQAKVTEVDGPNVFPARHEGKKGILVIERGTTGPAHADLVFLRGKSERETAKVEIAKMVEIRKIGGLGWKGRLVAGWALGTDIPDGLEITSSDGKKVLFTAMPRRDELFDRLVAMGAQRWETL